MPHGKFKGVEICDLPTWYLKFVAECWNEATTFDKKLIIKADKEYQERLKDGDYE